MCFISLKYLWNIDFFPPMLTVYCYAQEVWQVKSYKRGILKSEISLRGLMNSKWQWKFGNMCCPDIYVPVIKDRCQWTNSFKNYFIHPFSLVIFLKMCSGDHSAEKSFLLLGKLYILCCPFEILCNNFHLKDSGQSYRKLL